MKVLKLNEWVQTSTADKNLYNENGSKFSFMKNWKNRLDNQKSWIDAIYEIVSDYDDNKIFSFYVDCSGSMEQKNINDIFNCIYDLRGHGYNDITPYAYNSNIKPIKNNSIPQTNGGTIPFDELINYIDKNDDSEINIIITDTDEFQYKNNVNKAKTKINSLYDNNKVIFIITNNQNTYNVLKDSTPTAFIKNQHQNKLSPDTLNAIIDLITSGTDPDVVDYKNGRRIPITHETIYELFPDMSKIFLDVIENKLKKRGLDWKYPHNEDAANDHSRNDWKTYDWTLDELNDACGI